MVTIATPAGFGRRDDGCASSCQDVWKRGWVELLALKKGERIGSGGRIGRVEGSSRVENELVGGACAKANLGSKGYGNSDQVLQSEE